VYLEETFEFQLLLLDIFEFQDSRLSNFVTTLLSEPTEVESRRRREVWERQRQRQTKREPSQKREKAKFHLIVL
jgi:hypothetical protein